jgi:hypothetical protein
MSTKTEELQGCAAHLGPDIALSESVRHDELTMLAVAEPHTIGVLALLSASAAPTYFSWSHSGFNVYAPEYEICAPALQSIFTYAQRTYGATSYGCHYNRYIAGTTTWSTHAFGRAYDIFISGRTNMEHFWDFLIYNYVALGINTIHDYVMQRMWKPGQGWVGSSIGSKGGLWTHVECTPAASMDGRSVEDKVHGFQPPDEEPIIYDPWHDKWGLFPVNPSKPQLSWLSGYAPPETAEALRPSCTYFNHVMIFKTKHFIKEPYFVFTGAETGGSIAAMRDMHNFFDPTNSNKGLAFETYVGVCGTETWKLTDNVATNFGH